MDQKQGPGEQGPRVKSKSPVENFAAVASLTPRLRGSQVKAYKGEGTQLRRLDEPE